MPFKYPHTCPDIDRQISEAKSVLKDYFRDLISDICPVLGAKELDEIVEKYTKYTYEDLEDIFEKVRSTNEDMREEANRQIESLEDDVSDLQEKIYELEYSYE